MDEVTSSGTEFGDLWTYVLIILQETTIKESELAVLRQEKDPLDWSQKLDVLVRHHDRAYNTLNRIIIAYATATGESEGGLPLATLNRAEFGRRLEFEFVVLCAEDHDFSEHDLLQLLLPGAGGQIGPLISAALHDLDHALIQAIPEAISRQRDLVFYEFAFDARSKLHSGDLLSGLLMAIAALEAVHAKLVRIELSKRLSSLWKSGLPQGKTLNDLLREQGLHALNPATPFLLMAENERPSPDDLVLCQKAIEMRNAIVHALPRKDKPKMRTYKSSELREASEAVLRVYACYRAAVETRLR